MSSTDTDRSRRIAILAPVGRDANLIHTVLGEAGVESVCCRDVQPLLEVIRDGVGAVLITEEALTPRAAEALAAGLADQPPWSDLPLLALTGMPSMDANRRPFGELAERVNLILIDRPIRIKVLLSTIRAALRARERQYEVRELMELLHERIAERDRFLAVLGHELRNPLAAILIAVQDRDENEGVGAQHARLIERQTRHLIRLVDDLLNLTRVTAGKIALQLQAVDLGALVRHCWETSLERARERGLELLLTPPEEPIILNADPIRLEQIVGNLLTNAIKYTSRGGRVSIEVVRDGGEALIRVRDTGIGIPDDQQGKIFDLFTQASNVRAAAEQGLGIGLSLVRQLTELHGGTVNVSSSGLGKGSEFVVRLPITTAETSDRPPVRLEITGSSIEPRRIVVIDDNDDLRRLLATTLQRLGYEVTTAADGESGLRCIAEMQPDIGIIDIKMPGMDGYEVARRIREATKDSTPFLVALSGFGQPEDREDALRAGFDEHLTKPIDREGLDALLRRAASPRRLERA